MSDKPALHHATNTATWIGELYSKRLARQSLEFLGRDADEENPVLSLSRLRESRLFLRQELVQGPGFKQSVRAYFVAPVPADHEIELLILHCDYDPRNGRVRSNRSPVARVALSHHALERLFERLRTNGLGDVYRIAFRPLSRVPLPIQEEYGLEGVVLHLESFGVFPAKVIGSLTGLRIAPCWGCLTYVDRNPKQGERIAHTIGLEH